MQQWSRHRLRHLTTLTYIDAVAREGSIRRAAESLAITSTALNRRILAVEEELGVPIAQRLDGDLGPLLDVAEELRRQTDQGHVVLVRTQRLAQVHVGGALRLRVVAVQQLEGRAALLRAAQVIGAGQRLLHVHREVALYVLRERAETRLDGLLDLLPILGLLLGDASRESRELLERAAPVALLEGVRGAVQAAEECALLRLQLCSGAVPAHTPDLADDLGGTRADLFVHEVLRELDGDRLRVLQLLLFEELASLRELLAAEPLRLVGRVERPPDTADEGQHGRGDAASDDAWVDAAADPLELLAGVRVVRIDLEDLLEDVAVASHLLLELERGGDPAQ